MTPSRTVNRREFLARAGAAALSATVLPAGLGAGHPIQREDRPRPRRLRRPRRLDRQALPEARRLRDQRGRGLFRGPGGGGRRRPGRSRVPALLGPGRLQAPARGRRGRRRDRDAALLPPGAGRGRGRRRRPRLPGQAGGRGRPGLPFDRQVGEEGRRRKSGPSWSTSRRGPIRRSSPPSRRSAGAAWATSSSARPSITPNPRGSSITPRSRPIPGTPSCGSRPGASTGPCRAT